MSDLRTIRTGDVAIRSDADGDGRTIYGYAYRWGETTEGAEEYPGLREGFERGAFAAAIAARGDRPWVFLDRHQGRVVGAVRFSEDDTGLAYEGRLLDTEAARDYAASVPAGADGVSLEFLLRGAKSVRKGKTIMHRAIQGIAALAGVYAPAFTGATVAIRSTAEGDDMDEHDDDATPETPVPASAITLSAEAIRRLATDAATEAMRSYAERGALTYAPADPLAGFRSLGELVVAAGARDADPELRAYAARALADTVFTAGANAGLASGNLVTSEIQGIVNAGRPAITAFGGPRSLGDIAGLSLQWPYFDGTLADFVAAQSAEKAEIESASVDIKLATEALVTYAGGSDISYQVIRRGSPSVLDAYARIWLAAWAAVTDAAFVTELETGSVTIDMAEALASHDLTELIGNLVDASVAIQAATGRGLEFVLASTTAFAQYAKLIAAASVTVALPPQINLAGLTVGISNVPIIHVPGVTAGKLIASNSMAAAWYEDGPFQASEEDVAKLGRNVAYWSMGAGARFVPAGIIEIYDVTP